MTESEIRRRIEKRYQRSQDSIEQARSFVEPDRHRKPRERPPEPRKIGADRELDFVMSGFLLVIVVATIATGALALLVDGTIEPGRVIMGSVVAVPTAIVLMYVSYILTYIIFRAFWMFQAIGWLLGFLWWLFVLLGTIL
jgi:hypothetical protein